jgi:arsenite transporter
MNTQIQKADPEPESSAHEQDAEKQETDGAEEDTHVSAFKNLGFLDQYLAVWILLVMTIGIVLGNFVPKTGPALQKGKFVGVSVPIGMYLVQRHEQC